MHIGGNRGIDSSLNNVSSSNESGNLLNPEEINNLLSGIVKELGGKDSKVTKEFLKQHRIKLSFNKKVKASAVSISNELAKETVNWKFVFSQLDEIKKESPKLYRAFFSRMSEKMAICIKAEDKENMGHFLAHCESCMKLERDVNWVQRKSKRIAKLTRALNFMTNKVLLEIESDNTADKKVLMECLEKIFICSRRCKIKYEEILQKLEHLFKSKASLAQFATVQMKRDPSLVEAMISSESTNINFLDNGSISHLTRKDSASFLSLTKTKQKSVIKDLRKLFKHASEEVKADRELALHVMTMSGDAYAALLTETSFDKDKNFILEVAKSNPHIIKHVAPELKSDRSFMKACLAVNPACYEFLDTSLQQEPDVIVIAVKEKASYCKDHIAVLNKDPDSLDKVLEANPLTLAYLPRDSQTPEIVLKAVEKNGLALAYVDKAKIDEDLCMAAVKNNGCSLEFVPKEIKTETLEMAAIAQDAFALSFCREKTKPLCEAAFKVNPKVKAVITVEQHQELGIASEPTNFDRHVELRDEYWSPDKFHDLPQSVVNPDKQITVTEKQRSKGKGREYSKKTPALKSDYLAAKLFEKPELAKLRARLSQKNDKEWFIRNSLAYLDSAHTHRDAITYEWFEQVFDCLESKFTTEEKVLFKQFLRDIKSMSNQWTNSRITGKELTEAIFVGKKQFIRPNTPGHFCYMRAFKTDNNTVRVHVGNTGQGAQGLDKPGKKINVIQAYDIKRKDGEGDADFKDRVSQILDRLQDSSLNGVPEQNADIFMNKIVPEELGEPTEVIREGNAQSAPNCIVKGMVKGAFWEICQEERSPECYFSIQAKMTELLEEMFEGTDLEPRAYKKRKMLEAKTTKAGSRSDVS